MDFKTVHTDASRELGAAWANSQNLALAMARGASFVFGVVPMGHISEIRNPVVELISVYMVKPIGRPLAMNVEPCKTMGSEVGALDSQYQVAPTFVDAACRLSNDSFRSGNFPNEKTSFRIVVEMLSEVFRGHRKINLAHAVAPHMQWSGKWSPTVSAAGLCAF